MTSLTSMVEMAGRMLGADVREAILGDLAETGVGEWGKLFAVLGYVARREMELWRSWRPWVAGAVALPGSLLLLGASFSLSMDSRGLMQGDSVHWTLGLEAFLLVGWAWTSGFLVGSVSGRTRWVSAMLCAAPCLSCVLRFRDPSLSRWCVLLFLLPGIVGVLQGMRYGRLQLWMAWIVAGGLTMLMVAWPGMSLWNWLLAMPAWFLVVRAGGTEEAGQGVMA